MHKFDTPAPVSTVLDIPAGRIQFIAADRADTTVEIRPADAAKSRDVKAAERIGVAYRDGVLRIEAEEATSRVLGASGSVEVTVQLPAGSRIEAKAADAELRGVGRLGDVAFEGARGSVKLDETASARLTLQSGDVSVGRLGGPAQISTLKGDLSIAEAVTGTVTLRTEYGDISVGAAREASAVLDAGTAHGRVHNALRNADGAAAGLTIHATTAHGDITARSR
jgi:putative adhesin